MRSAESIRTIIEAGLGHVPCDLRLENIRLVNVFSSEVYPSVIHIKDGRIVSVDPDVRLESKQVVDGQGCYALPGLIDTHVHFESTMLAPEAVAEVIVPHGTTTMCADLMEIANVAGAAGLKALLQSRTRLPYRILIEVSSRVPTAPGLETTGAILGAAEVMDIMGWEESVSLGELDPSKILFPKDEYLHKIADTLGRRKIVNGHAIGRLGQELNIYASAGISDDHECVEVEELLARLRVGIKVLVREGSTERNLDKLIAGVLAHKIPFDNLMFCTDDKHATEIREEGHIDYIVNRAVELGVPPIEALKMATVNAAKHFRLEDELGSLTPGRLADIILSRELTPVLPESVYFEGKEVARNGRLLKPCPVGPYPEWMKKTFIRNTPVTAASFAVPAKSTGDTATVNVIGLIPEQIINTREEAVLQVLRSADGAEILADPARDILRLAVVERYGKNDNVSVGFVRGFGLQAGALAYSMSHDHHNIVCVGVDAADMALAVNRIVDMQGGLTVANAGHITAEMHLPLGGLMSEGDAETVMAELTVMNEAVVKLGCAMPAPFMTLSFISLPTVPELGLTDMGLVDVMAHTLIPVEKIS